MDEQEKLHNTEFISSRITIKTHQRFRTLLQPEPEQWIITCCSSQVCSGLWSQNYTWRSSVLLSWSNLQNLQVQLSSINQPSARLEQLHVSGLNRDWTEPGLFLFETFYFSSSSCFWTWFHVLFRALCESPRVWTFTNGPAVQSEHTQKHAARWTDPGGSVAPPGGSSREWRTLRRLQREQTKKKKKKSSVRTTNKLKTFC